MRQLKKLIATFSIAIITFTLLFFSKDTMYLNLLELKTVDQRFQNATKNLDASSEIAVVLIDESSLQSLKGILGRWPWPRMIYKDLLDFFAAAGAKAVLFDILFTEPQVPRDQDGELGEDDQALVLASYESEIAHHAYQILPDIEDEFNKSLLDRPLPDDFVDVFSWGDTPDHFQGATNNQYYIPFDELYQFTTSMGIVEFSPDPDGVYRSTHLLRDYQGKLFPTLSMSAFSQQWEKREIIIHDHVLKIDQTQIPLHYDQRYLINMKKHYVNYSAAGILATIQKLNQGITEDLIVDPDEFTDKIILIGGSAVGIEDLKNTSIGKSFPGVYLHASIISNLIDNDFLIKKDNMLFWGLLITLLILLTLLIVFIPQQWVSFCIYLVISLTYLYFSFYQFDEHRYLYPMAVPSLMFLAVLLLSYIYRSMTEGKEKKFLKEVFGNYISPELIEMMYDSEQTPQLGGQSQVITAFFTDIASFSSFSEKLSASDLVDLLNEYLTDMTNILLEEKGTLDKYIGDAIVAFFGAPLPLEDHPRKACITAIKMQKKLSELRMKWRSEGDRWPDIVKDMTTRIGIHTDNIVTGNMGSATRMNYTMMGDGVNLAARLESSAKYYGIFNQVSDETIKQAGTGLLYRELDLVRVIGRSRPVKTYELLDFNDQATSELHQLVQAFQLALSQYKQRNWQQAIELFEKSAKLEQHRMPDLTMTKNPSLIYIERCQHYLANPPPADWDGVYNLESK